MKKFILLSILSVLFYSAPGNAGGGLLKLDTIREILAEVPKEIIVQRQATVASLEAALAEATVASREAAEAREAAAEATVASLEAALAEATVASLEAALAEATVASLEATVAPATEAATTRASLERQLVVCVESLAHTSLANAQRAFTIFQKREDALQEHLSRIDTMRGANTLLDISLRNRSFSYPEELKQETDNMRRSKITNCTSSIGEDSHFQVYFSLAGLAQDKEVVITTIQKALGLQSAVAAAACQEQGLWEPVDAAVLRNLAAAERAEAETKLYKYKQCFPEVTENEFPPGMPRHEVVDLAKKKLSEMDGILNEMSIEFLVMWEEEIDYHKEALGLSATVRTAKEAHAAVEGCCGALFKQAAEKGSYTPESKGPSVDVKTLLGRCSDLMSDIDKFWEGTVQKSSEYIALSQSRWDASRERGVSFVEAIPEPPLVGSEEVAHAPEAAADRGEQQLALEDAQDEQLRLLPQKVDKAEEVAHAPEEAAATAPTTKKRALGAQEPEAPATKKRERGAQEPEAPATKKRERGAQEPPDTA